MISESDASRGLRTLNARGLLRVERVGRWVRYRMGHNATIPDTQAVVKALRKQLDGEKVSIEEAFRDFTAFTHPRRIRIYRVLSQSAGLTFLELRGQTGISMAALCRHVRKLRDRGLVNVSCGTCVHRRGKTPLQKALVRLAARDAKA